MGEKDIRSFIIEAKKATVDAAHTIADTAVSVAGKTQAAVLETTTKIKDDMQKKHIIMLSNTINIWQ